MDGAGGFAEVMPRGKLVAAPRRKPVGPAQIKNTAGLEQLGQVVEQMVGVGQVFQNVGTHHQVELAIAGKIGVIEVDLPEGAVLHFLESKIFVVGKGHLGASGGAEPARVTVAAAEIQHAGTGPNLDAALLQPFKGVLCLQFKECPRVFLVIEVEGNEAMDDHRQAELCTRRGGVNLGLSTTMTCRS